MSTIDLDALERIARAVETPGPWETRCEGYKEPTRVCHDSEYVIYLGYDFAADLGAQDAEHIAAFDPPTVLALIARVRELEAIVNDGGNQAAKYWTRLTAAEREMHARELHHFEAEQAMREALELIQPGGFMRPDEPGYVGTTRDVVQARAILTRALNDKEAEK
ncbi:hypothetical protein PQI51_03295 [Microbacterium esteraromaticum]|uniref:hypothetical protein n=1 Tax=Microbacterium esteraromaticum TaxID=57043 RepID=UPI00309E1115